jgi:hypothetical protein
LVLELELELELKLELELELDLFFFESILVFGIGLMLLDCLIDSFDPYY